MNDNPWFFDGDSEDYDERKWPGLDKDRPEGTPTYDDVVKNNKRKNDDDDDVKEKSK